MVIDISELLSTKEKTEEFSIPVEADEYTLSGLTYEVTKKAPVLMKFSNIGPKKISMEGSIKMTLSVPCSRCLKEVPVDFDIDIDRELDLNNIDDDDFDGAAYIDESNINIENFVSGELLIHFPMKTLCRQDCKGLCIKCGRDLNDGECNCNRESLDPRMAAIQDVFKQFKEV